MEITKAVIFFKCHDFAKMLCFAMFLAKMPWFYYFVMFLQLFFIFNQYKWCDFDTKIFIFAIAAKVCMLFYLLAQYVTVTSL